MNDDDDATYVATEYSGDDATYVATEYSGDGALEGERQLWMAVLIRAVQDATAETVGSFNLERNRARTWFKSNGRDFRTVCYFAGADPDYVREQVLERIEQTNKQPNKQPNKQSNKQTCDQEAKLRSGRGRLYRHDDGREMTLAEWATECGINFHTLSHRVWRGMSITEATTTPIGFNRQRRSCATATISATAHTTGGTSKIFKTAKGPADPHRATSDRNSDFDISRCIELSDALQR